MAWRLKSTKVERLTRKLLQEWLALEVLNTDRPLNPKRVKYLLAEFHAGRFTSATWAKVLYEGRWFRLNGQHTSQMFSVLETIPQGVSITVQTYEAESRLDVAEIYTTFDPIISSRNSNDIYRQYQGSNESFAEIGKDVFNRIVSGISYADHEDSYSATTAQMRAERAMEVPNFVHFVNRLFTETENQDEVHLLLLRQSVIAAVYLTWRKSQEKAREFWRETIDGSNPDKTSPSRVLQKYLLKTSVGSGRGKLTGKQAVTRHEMFARSLTAWNAWRRNEGTALKYFGKTPTVV